MPLSQEEIAKLLAPPRSNPPQGRARTAVCPPPVGVSNKGPLRWYDTPRRCLHEAGFHKNGCKSPTHLTVEGKPLCLMHAVLTLNNMLIELQESPRTLVQSIGAAYDRQAQEPIL